MLSLTLEWNGPLDRPFIRFDGADLQRDIVELFFATAARNPDRPAIEDADRTLSYREAAIAVHRLAERIASTTQAGALVGVMLSPSAMVTVALLACLCAGRPCLPLDSHYPAAWIRQVVEDAAPLAIVGDFADSAADAWAPEGVKRIDIRAALVENAAAVVAAARLQPDDPAIVLYTSGSTGKPKGIVNSQRNLLRRSEQYINAAHINADDRFLPLSSACTIAGLRERLTALLSGATLLEIDAQLAGAPRILQSIYEQRPTVIYAVPALLRALIQIDEGAEPPALRVVRVGGDTVLWSDIDLLRGWLAPSCLIELGYSSTEAPIMQWFVPPDFPRTGGGLPIGYPLAGNDLAIEDDDGFPVAPGEVGELVVRSRYVALGKWVDCRCLRGDFPPDSNDPERRVLRTGDLVRTREDGFIERIGRKDGQIKIRGQRVELGEVEAAIRARAGVRDAAVMARREASSVMLVGYVVPMPGQESRLRDRISAELRSILPLHMVPQQIYAVDAIPRLPSAKLDRVALSALDEANRSAEASAVEAYDAEADTATTASGEDLESRILAIWRKAMRQPALTADDDFFDYGGDSLMAITIMFQIGEALDIELPVTMIYETPTARHLTAAIEQHRAAEFSPLVPIRRGDPDRALVLVHGVGGNVMELFTLGRAIETQATVFALQAQGLDGKQEPNRTIEDMAKYGVAAVRQVQSTGPYYLAGYSYGGLVALEMARALLRDGEQVAFLGLLDGRTSPKQWPLRAWPKVIKERTRAHMTMFRRLAWAGRMQLVAMVARSLRRRLKLMLGIALPVDAASYVAGLPPALQRVRDGMLEASLRYRPTYFAGQAVLFKPEQTDPGMCEADAIWINRVGSLEVVRVAGDHATMIRDGNARELASLISRRISPDEPKRPATSEVRRTRGAQIEAAAN